MRRNGGGINIQEGIQQWGGALAFKKENKNVTFLYVVQSNGGTSGNTLKA